MRFIKLLVSPTLWVLSVLMLLAAIWNPGIGAWWQWLLTSIISAFAGSILSFVSENFNLLATVEMQVREYRDKIERQKYDLENLIISQEHVKKRGIKSQDSVTAVLENHNIFHCPCGCGMPINRSHLPRPPASAERLRLTWAEPAEGEYTNTVRSLPQTDLTLP